MMEESIMGRNVDMGVDRLYSKIVVYGADSMEKKVHRSGSCGRVYLPSSWAGKKVIIIKMNEEVSK
jgi:putative transposon-encoded protein